MEEISISTSKRIEFIDITSKIRKAIEASGVKDGICVVYCPHTTAGLTINENADPDVIQDIKDKLNELVPAGVGYRHIEGNADSHIKSSLVGNTVNLIVNNGRLMLGTWQGIFFCEFDGPRTRKVWVAVK
ncbi:MAG: YjbQ family protein [Candidatus Marinimicrobia bacterium]|nr:YjbQ family protein [Candidatus Neomarinimicrobiota bacterium]